MWFCRSETRFYFGAYIRFGVSFSCVKAATGAASTRSHYIRIHVERTTMPPKVHKRDSGRREYIFISMHKCLRLLSESHQNVIYIILECIPANLRQTTMTMPPLQTNEAQFRSFNASVHQQRNGVDGRHSHCCRPFARKCLFLSVLT